jgi:quinol monooxygenase YgiN
MVDDNKIYLSGYLDVPAERWDAVMDALPKHIELTMAEAGCISFDVKPCPDTANRLLVAEAFEDQAAFDFHQARNKASVWFQTTLGIARHFNIEVGTP